MLAVTTSTNVPPGKKKNDFIYIALVKLSCPWSPEEKYKSYDRCPFKKAIAVTSEGVEFTWKDETVSPEITRNARHYGIALHPPCYWGERKWKEIFEE